MKHIIPSLLLLCTLIGYSQKTPTPEDRWTPQEIIHLERVSNPVFSEDGRMIAWTKRIASGKEEADNFVQQLYLTRLGETPEDTPETIALTGTDETHRDAVFSKDGKYLYFLSSRKKGKKLWRLPLAGGEAQEVYEFKTGVSNLQWRNNTELLFLTNEGKTLEESLAEDKKDDVISIEDTLYWKADRLFSLDVENKRMTRITTNQKPLSDYIISPDGRWVITEEQQSISFAADARKDPHYYLTDLATGTQQRILTELTFPAGGFAFSPNSNTLYFLSQTASDPEWNGAGITQLYAFTPSTGNLEKIELQWENGVGDGFLPLENGVLVSLADGPVNQIRQYTKGRKGWESYEIKGGSINQNTDLMAVSPQGNILVTESSSASTLPTWQVQYLSKGKVSQTQTLVSLNAKLAKKPLAKSEILRWKGYQGEEVNGILYYPENYQPGKKYPLILSIHGGPSGVDMDRFSDRWSTYPNILSQRGAFVLKPNYHGSSNHGLKFVESIKGNYYEPEMEDLTSAIAYLSEKGMVDTEKLGAMGWSNGAILTTMLTVRYPGMFKAAAAGAGDVNWTSDYGTCEFGVSFDQSYFKGAPWDNLNGKTYNENYILKSPLFEMEKVKTPTIIFHGSEDRAVPRDQGWEYFRALQQLEQAPVKFLWFPGQPHGLLKVSHQERKMEEELAWIDTYLFGKPTKPTKTIKDDSPLAALLLRQKTSTSGYQKGKVMNGVLVPETTSVAKDSIEIGVFEITNAQFASYDKNFSYAERQENYPAEVSLEQAKTYVQWLSETTGSVYRLPSEKEAAKWHDLAITNGSKENTLFWWTGYALTREEGEKLLAQYQHIGKNLIKEVGQHGPVFQGQAALFDLGGNVAEWSQTGTTYGFHASEVPQPSDFKGRLKSRAGFRVVKE